MRNAGIEDARWSQEGGIQSSLGSLSPKALPLGGWRVRRRNYLESKPRGLLTPMCLCLHLKSLDQTDLSSSPVFAVH